MRTDEYTYTCTRADLANLPSQQRGSQSASKRRVRRHERFHLVMTVVWALTLAAAVGGLVLMAFGVKSILLLLLGVAFISLCSIYANMTSHWSAYEAAKGQED